MMRACLELNIKAKPKARGISREQVDALTAEQFYQMLQGLQTADYYNNNMTTYSNQATTTPKNWGWYA